MSGTVPHELVNPTRQPTSLHPALSLCAPSASSFRRFCSTPREDRDTNERASERVCQLQFQIWELQIVEKPKMHGTRREGESLICYGGPNESRHDHEREYGCQARKHTAIGAVSNKCDTKQTRLIVSDRSVAEVGLVHTCSCAYMKPSKLQVYANVPLGLWSSLTLRRRKNVRPELEATLSRHGYFLWL